MQKIFIAKIFRGLPSDGKKKKKKSGPPFLPWKLRVNPIEKHVNSIFNGKSVVIFFQGPLTRVKNFKGPPFCIRPPYKCLWTVPKLPQTLFDIGHINFYTAYTSNIYVWRLRQIFTKSLNIEWQWWVYGGCVGGWNIWTNQWASSCSLDPDQRK